MMTCVFVSTIVFQISSTILAIWNGNNVRKIKRKEQKKTLMPSGLIVLLNILGWFCLVPTCIQFIQDKMDSVLILLALCCIFLDVFTICMLFQTVIYDEKEISIGIPFIYIHKYEYNDIRGIETGVTYYRRGRNVYTCLIVGNKQIHSGIYYTGFEDFMKYACLMYENNGERLPLERKEKQSKLDVYNGNLKSPGNYVVKYCLIIFTCFLFATIFLCDYYNNSIKKEDFLIFLCIVLFFMMLAIIAFIVSIHIGKNPQKYNKRIRKLFFHEEDWNVDFNKLGEK